MQFNLSNRHEETFYLQQPIKQKGHIKTNSDNESARKSYCKPTTAIVRKERGGRIPTDRDGKREVMVAPQGVTRRLCGHGGNDVT